MSMQLPILQVAEEQDQMNLSKACQEHPDFLYG